MYPRPLPTQTTLYGTDVAFLYYSGSCLAGSSCGDEPDLNESSAVPAAPTTEPRAPLSALWSPPAHQSKARETPQNIRSVCGGERTRAPLHRGA
eukprot:4628505-Prymnesium_polylepis.1